MIAKLIIGIDPGEKGFIATYDIESGERKYLAIADHTIREISDFLKGLSAQYGPSNVSVCIEEVHAIFGSSAKATFNFGKIFGILQGIVIASGVSYSLVQPKEWQKEIWNNADKVTRYNRAGGKMVDTKGTSLNAARRLFPAIDFRRTSACKKVDDNKIDATLIAEYARRKNL